MKSAIAIILLTGLIPLKSLPVNRIEIQQLMVKPVYSLKCSTSNQYMHSTLSITSTRACIDFGNHQTFTRTTLMRLPQRNINAVAGLVAGVDSRAGETPNIKGARADGTAYFIDGMRTYANELITELTILPSPGSQKYPF